MVVTFPLIEPVCWAKSGLARPRWNKRRPREDAEDTEHQF